MTEADRRALRARLATRLRGAWRTRFAPAPTGHLHLGHAVNAVYVWSIAQAFGGTVLVRIEDHDRQRARTTYDDSILADLAWLGLGSDNARLGEAMPVRQSTRSPSYAAALEQLSLAAPVYPCRCSTTDVA
ncbi:MAG: glutamate--tRNA ligase family protein [Gemmatimonadaceae bacterium]|nr:glutamate--tRNA ligase family protein [Gemmatimonadaceae bacterium]